MMADWEEDTVYDDSDSLESGEWTPWRTVTRIVALVLLFSLLAGISLALRGIEDILVVIGILLVAALVAKIAKKQRQAENPYRSDDRPDIRAN